MPELNRTQAAQTLRSFCAAHPSWALFDETSETLLEIATGKRLHVPLGEIVSLGEHTNARSGSPYLALQFGDGRALAIADAGIAFPPLAPPIDQAPAMPPVVCLRDFSTLMERLAHQLLVHPDEQPPRETLDAVALCLGILGGARQLGFDISDEERALEPLIAQLEKRL